MKKNITTKRVNNYFKDERHIIKYILKMSIGEKCKNLLFDKFIIKLSTHTLSYKYDMSSSNINKEIKKLTKYHKIFADL